MAPTTTPKSIWIVVGANYGDEGKGLLVDALCHREWLDTKEGASGALVVRYNGGAQAGHTVCHRNGTRHVFHHFGSGTLSGADTWFDKGFFCNPILFAQEHAELKALLPNFEVKVNAHKDCHVTTYVDMLINQHLERMSHHGSVGVGINETFQRSLCPEFNMSISTGKYEFRSNMIDWTTHRLEMLAKKLGGQPTWADHVMKMATSREQFEKFWADMDFMKVRTTRFNGGSDDDTFREISAGRVLVFEGAQGLGLDMVTGSFPHVTPSRTGSVWALETISRVFKLESGLPPANVIYVSRSYNTRHGTGPFPEYDPAMFFGDDTNVSHEWQGSIRFGPLDPGDWMKRIRLDLLDAQRTGVAFKPYYAFTHLDQTDGAVLCSPTTRRDMTTNFDPQGLINYMGMPGELIARVSSPMTGDLKWEKY